MELPLRGHPDEMFTSLERPIVNVKLNIKEWITTPEEKPPFLKGHKFLVQRVCPHKRGSTVHVFLTVPFSPYPTA